MGNYSRCQDISLRSFSGPMPSPESKSIERVDPFLVAESDYSLVSVQLSSLASLHAVELTYIGGDSVACI